MNSNPINQFAQPTSTSLKPPKYSKPILTPGYELCLYFINKIQEQPFSREDDANLYLHLREFELTCVLLHITDMSNKTLRWKFFLLSLVGKGK